jgi:hypothetical protein
MAKSSQAPANQPAVYSRKKMERDLERVRDVFNNVSASRDKAAIYKYWHAIYKLSRKWRRLRKNEGVKIETLAKRMLKGMPPSSSTAAIRFIINATSSTNDQSTAGRTKLNKLRSKYSSLLNYAYKQRVKTSDVDKFIKDHGGLNYKPGQKGVPSAKRMKQKKGR